MTKSCLCGKYNEQNWLKIVKGLKGNRKFGEKKQILNISWPRFHQLKKFIPSLFLPLCLYSFYYVSPLKNLALFHLTFLIYISASFPSPLCFLSLSLSILCPSISIDYISLSLSLSHTNTRTITISLSLSLSRFFTPHLLSIFLSLFLSISLSSSLIFWEVKLNTLKMIQPWL